MYSASDLKKGLKIQIDGQPWVITEFDFCKPGKGTALYRCKMKNLITGSGMEHTYRPTDKIEKPDLEEREMYYSYADGDNYVFSDVETYEEIHVHKDFLGKQAFFLIGNDAYNLLTDNPTPRINYGFGGSFKWKGIAVDLHFQGVGAYDRFVGGVDGGFYQHGGANRPYFAIWAVGDTYDPEYNPDGKYPRIVGSGWYESGVGNTSFWMRNGAYLRLKNLNIGYDLPKNWLRPLGVQSVQVFANATNLFSISHVGEFLDPEQKYYDSYPIMRTFSFGLNLTF